MKLQRIPYDPGSVLAFYEDGLTTLGALCERTWHDKLEIIAEGPPATLWNPQGQLHSAELHFAPSDASAARDPSRQVFPGSPLTFKLAEALRSPALTLERVTLNAAAPSAPPDSLTLEKHWRSQFPGTGKWTLADDPKPAWHFSLLALTRLDVQAIDQHWFLYRTAIALPSGEPDEHLARELDFADVTPEPAAFLPWPPIEPAPLAQSLSAALTEELAPDLDAIRARQQAMLQRELERIDAYFEHYAAELETRAKRSANQNTRIKINERLAASKAEHARRRTDQVSRHEIRILPHLDALLLLAEPAWSAQLNLERDRKAQNLTATYLRRSRRWFQPPPQ